MRNKTLLLVAAAVACTRAPATTPTPVSAFETVITGGKIIDGTGNSWYYGDVGVSGDRITRIAAPGMLRGASAQRRIDARGLVVAPGVIDIQAHSEEPLLTGDSRVVSMITQGVTTMIMGEGDTPGPMNDKLLAFLTDPADSLTLRAVRGFTGPRGFGAWLEAMQRRGASVNVGSFVGAGTVRAYAKGMTQGPLSAAELDTVLRVVRDAMLDGSFGLASALIYPPGNYASTEETIRQGARGSSPRCSTRMRSSKASVSARRRRASRSSASPSIHSRSTRASDCPKSRRRGARTGRTR